MEEKIKLTINELFSGIGCQRRGFENSELFDIEVANTSDINKEAVLSYAAVHCGMTNKMVLDYTGYPPREEMAQYLTDINLGYDPDRKKEFDWFKLAKRKNKDLEKYWLACKLSNNLGDISRIDKLQYADLWTFSFPCQSISISGKQTGIIKGKTRSGLVYEVTRLLEKAKDKNTLPKYLMLENVPALVSKKFIGDFNNLNNFFDNAGYNIYWSLINGKNCGVPQNRTRCFAIYIRKDIDTKNYTFPEPFDTGIRLEDVLEENVDEKYYIPDVKVTKFLENLKEEHPGLCGVQEPDIIKIGKINSSQDGVVVSPNGISPTHTAGHSNVTKILKVSKNLYKKPAVRIRRLTPRECWKLMGLTFEDCDKAFSIGVANTHLYKQAGNGIITNCCELLAEHLYKAQYDGTYTCKDERYSGNFTSPQAGQHLLVGMQKCFQQHLNTRGQNMQSKSGKIMRQEKLKNADAT